MPSSIRHDNSNFVQCTLAGAFLDAAHARAGSGTPEWRKRCSAAASSAKKKQSGSFVSSICIEVALPEVPGSKDTSLSPMLTATRRGAVLERLVLSTRALLGR